MNSTQYICTEEDNYKRIDYLLTTLVAEMGLRGRRRLCEQGLIHINDKRAKASDKVRMNNVITIYTPDESALTQENPSVYIIKESTDYAAIYKPTQMHSESLRGTISNNIQDQLPILFTGKNPLLLNRLDFATSGIIMIAFSHDAKETWELSQSRKNIKKTYIALIEGKLEHETNIRNALLLKNKHNVRVDKNYTGQRHTKIIPLAHAKDKDGNDISLVSCVMTQGARHQIRAHLASIGHPLVNDIKYDAKKQHPLTELTTLSMLGSPLVPYYEDSYDANDNYTSHHDTNHHDTNHHDISSNVDRTNITSTQNDNNEQKIDLFENIACDIQANARTAEHYHVQEHIQDEDTSHETHETHETHKTHETHETHETYETHKSDKSQKIKAHIMKNGEFFILHHMKIECSHFETLCLPEFWQNIAPEVQQHILSSL